MRGQLAMQRTWCGLEQVDWYDPGSHESVLAVQSPRLPPFTRRWLAGREMAGGSGAPLPHRKMARLHYSISLVGVYVGRWAAAAHVMQHVDGKKTV